jgi:hypothetical protein
MWRDIFETRLLQLKQDVRFRRAPADFFLPERAADFPDKCEYMCKEAFAGTNANDLLTATLRQHLARQSRMTDGWLVKTLDKAPLKASTALRARQNILWQIEQDEKSVIIYFYDRRLVLPLAVRPAVDRLLSGETSQVSDLQANLDSNSSIFLGTKLLEAGLVEIVP